VPFLDASRISQYSETRTLFLGHHCHHSPTHGSVEDCPQGMHQDLMFNRRKGTRRGLASRGKALVQLAALPNCLSTRWWWRGGDHSPTMQFAGQSVVSNEDHLAYNVTGLFKTFRDPASVKLTMILLVKRPPPPENLDTLLAATDDGKKATLLSR